MQKKYLRQIRKSNRELHSADFWVVGLHIISYGELSTEPWILNYFVSRAHLWFQKIVVGVIRFERKLMKNIIVIKRDQLCNLATLRSKIWISKYIFFHFKLFSLFLRLVWVHANNSAVAYALVRTMLRTAD